jgi:hypothetical protein
MSLAVAVEQSEFQCSCGRAFQNEVKLMRHRKITNHVAFGEVALEQIEVSSIEVGAEVVEVEVDPNEAYELALRLIAEKRTALEQIESRRRADQLAQAFREEQRRQLDSFLTYIICLAKSTAAAGAKKTVRAGYFALAATTLVLMAVVLTSVGAGIGKALAQRHNTPSLVAYH